MAFRTGFQQSQAPLLLQTTFSRRVDPVSTSGTINSLLHQIVVPAKLFNTNGDAMRCYAQGFTSGGAGNHTFQVKFSGTTVFDSGGIFANNNRRWNYTILAIRIVTGAAVTFLFTIEFTVSFFGVIEHQFVSSFDAGAVDFDTTNTLDFFVDCAIGTDSATQQTSIAWLI